MLALKSQKERAFLLKLESAPAHDLDFYFPIFIRIISNLYDIHDYV